MNRQIHHLSLFCSTRLCHVLLRRRNPPRPEKRPDMECSSSHGSSTFRGRYQLQYLSKPSHCLLLSLPLPSLPPSPTKEKDERWMSSLFTAHDGDLSARIIIATPSTHLEQLPFTTYNPRRGRNFAYTITQILESTTFQLDASTLQTSFKQLYVNNGNYL